VVGFQRPRACASGAPPTGRVLGCVAKATRTVRGNATRAKKPLPSLLLRRWLGRLLPVAVSGHRPLPWLKLSARRLAATTWHQADGATQLAPNPNQLALGPAPRAEAIAQVLPDRLEPRERLHGPIVPCSFRAVNFSRAASYEPHLCRALLGQLAVSFRKFEPHEPPPVLAAHLAYGSTSAEGV